MERRDFLKVTGIGMGTLMLPVMGRPVHAEELRLPLELSFKKTLADAGLASARSAGATYADVRIGRYLNQFVVTREDKVQNIVNTESLGVGVRVDGDGGEALVAVDLGVARELDDFVGGGLVLDAVGVVRGEG